VGEHAAQPHEGAHDFHVDPYGALALQHRGEHGYALLGECARQVFRVPAAPAASAAGIV
jgi:hypothetical protein